MQLIYNVYYDSTHIHAKWLAEARGGGEYLLKTFPVSIMFNDKIRLLPKNEVLVLRNQKTNIVSYGELRGINHKSN